MSDENSVSSGDDPSIIEAPMEAEESLSSSSLPPSSNPPPPVASVEVQFSSNDRSVATFSFFDEDHTLGIKILKKTLPPFLTLAYNLYLKKYFR